MMKWLTSGGVLVGMVFVGGLLPSAGVLAAPYCVQTESIPPQCLYFDPSQCRMEAQHLKGWCVRNPEGSSPINAGTGAYCLLTTGGLVSVCEYQTEGDCMREAIHQGGVCTLAPTRTPEGNPPPDPYKYTRPPPVQ